MWLVARGARDTGWTPTMGRCRRECGICSNGRSRAVRMSLGSSSRSWRSMWVGSDPTRSRANSIAREPSGGGASPMTTLSLFDFETALGRAIRAAPGESPIAGDTGVGQLSRDPSAIVGQTPGFTFTRQVQQSWCRARATRAARLTLGLLAEADRQAILDSWLATGGG